MSQRTPKGEDSVNDLYHISDILYQAMSAKHNLTKFTKNQNNRIQSNYFVLIIKLNRIAIKIYLIFLIDFDCVRLHKIALSCSRLW